MRHSKSHRGMQGCLPQLSQGPRKSRQGVGIKVFIDTKWQAQRERVDSFDNTIQLMLAPMYALSLKPPKL